MSRVEDVVAYIKEQLPESGSMALCKLAYYAQAWHLTWEGSELYPERIEAWKDGPVPRRAWRALKDGLRGNSHTLSQVERQTIDAVVAFYGSLTGWQLRELSHNERPWVEARKGLPEGATSDAQISTTSMRRYYTLRSMVDKNVPTKAKAKCQTTPSVADVLAVARQEMPRWNGTLTRLADR
jgi:uncharacterized phage-associated protein